MSKYKKRSLLMVGLVAATVFATPVAEASSYVVQKGDTLTKIAKLHNTTVSQLQKWNNLKAESIYISQKLIVSNPKGKPTIKKPTATNKTAVKVTAPKQDTLKPPVASSPSTIVYKVLAGDNLSKIAKAYNVSIANIQLWNNLTTDAIYVGQSLKITPTGAAITNNSSTVASSTNHSSTTGNGNSEVATEEMAEQQMAEAELKIATQLSKEKMITAAPSTSTKTIYAKAVELAKSYIGTPYVYSGSTPEGFDCSGLVQYVYNAAGLSIKRLDSESYFMNGSTIVSSPVAGDLVFFKNTYKLGISHMGIYIGDGQFIHAGNNGVEMSKLSYNYWDTRFVAFKRFNSLIQ